MPGGQKHGWPVQELCGPHKKLGEGAGASQTEVQPDSTDVTFPAPDSQSRAGSPDCARASVEDTPTAVISCSPLFRG